MSELSETWLSSNDPQPPCGTVVETDWGQRWRRSYGEGYWLAAGREDGDPESWTKVAGNYGPVKLIEWGDGDA